MCGADGKRGKCEENSGTARSFYSFSPLSFFLSVLLGFFLLFILKRVFLLMNCYCRLWVSNPGLTWLYYAAGGHICKLCIDI